MYYTRYPQSESRAQNEWWAACKIRAKLFLAETLNAEDDDSNELHVIDYYQDDGSIRTHNIVTEDETISLFDANAPMEEVNVNEIHNPTGNLYDDQFIDDNEDSLSNEFIDEDEELYDSESSSDD